MTLLITGSIGLDSVETPAGSLNDGLGGSASYASSAASFFYDQVILSAAVGEDFPENYIDFYKSRKVDLAGLKIVKGNKTFRWQARYEGDLSEAQTLKTELNVLALPPEELSPQHKKSQYVFLANDSPQNQLKIINSLTEPRIIAADTMNLWIETDKDNLQEVISRINILFINDAEARLLTGQDDLLKAAQVLLTKGPKLVAVKKGREGALIVTGDNNFISPAYLTDQAKDTTGAGDSFAGSFMGYIASSGNLTIEVITKAACYGNTVASFVVEDFSLKAFENLTREKIEDRALSLRV